MPGNGHTLIESEIVWMAPRPGAPRSCGWSECVWFRLRLRHAQRENIPRSIAATVMICIVFMETLLCINEAT